MSIYSITDDLYYYKLLRYINRAIFVAKFVALNIDGTSFDFLSSGNGVYLLCQRKFSLHLPVTAVIYHYLLAHVAKLLRSVGKMIAQMHCDWIAVGCK